MSEIRRYTTVVLGTILLPFVLAAGQTAHAATPKTQTLRLYTWADTYSNTAHASMAYGKTRDIRVGNFGHANQVAFVRFSVPASAVNRVVSAKLLLTRTGHHLPGTTITVARAGNNWTEGRLTKKSSPAIARTYSGTWVNQSTNTVSINVTGAIKGQRTVALALRSWVHNDAAIFRSREAGSGIPTLELTLKANTPAAIPLKVPAPKPAPTPPVTRPPVTPPTASGCVTSSLLVPSCNVWFGDTPQAYTHTCFPLSKCLAIDEGFTARKFDIVHMYKVNGALFPNAGEIALANQGRTLSINWKPATDMTWADVAAGKADSRIDAEAAYLQAHFDRKFFLTIYHEPEDNVIATPGSGMTVADYVAMYRHTIKRLRADGSNTFISVMNYMGYYRWDSMRDALYPGDDVVDWIAWDPYMYNPSNQPGYDFAALVNTAHGSQPGMYDWATTQHPGKPLMLAEYGAFDQGLSGAPLGPSQFYPTITAQLPKFPALRALIHFTMNPVDVAAGQGTSPTETSAGLAAWRAVAQNPMFDVSGSP